MTQTYNNAAAHSRKCNGLTLAEQLAVQMIACRRWGHIETETLTIAAAKAWEVHGLGR